MSHPAQANVPEPVRTGPGDGARGGGGVVGLDTGRGGLSRVLVRSPSASAEVYLNGAHLTQWAPAGGRPVLWTSRHSDFAPGRTIRGGVPVRFSWSRPYAAGDGPAHGLVGDRTWGFAGWGWDSDDVVLTFVLSSTDVPGATQPFELRYTVTVGLQLTMELAVTNTGSEALRVEESLPTYLAVADVREALLLGLGDLDRLDRLTGRRSRTPAGAQLRVVAPTDHLYGRPADVTVVDWEGQRSVRVRAEGSAGTAVWNPWVDTAAALADFGDDEWSAMVCIEPCNVTEGAVLLPAGTGHRLVSSVDVGPLP